MFSRHVMFLKFREKNWVAPIYKPLTWGTKIISEFLSPSFGYCLWLGLGLRPPEAKHRCTRQPIKATMPWSRGSSRPRRPWMHRTTGAVASEEDIGGETSWGLGIIVKWTKCWWFKCFVDFVYHFLCQVSQCTKTFALTFSVVRCDRDFVVS